MGDRANIVIKGGNGQVWLYTHWDGSNVRDTARKAIKKNWRWNDPQYLARIVFQQLVGKDVGETGFGITDRMGDNAHPIVVLDTDKQAVYLCDEKTMVGEDGRIDDAFAPGHAIPFAKFATMTDKQLEAMDIG